MEISNKYNKIFYPYLTNAADDEDLTKLFSSLIERLLKHFMENEFVHIEESNVNYLSLKEEEELQQRIIEEEEEENAAIKARESMKLLRTKFVHPGLAFLQKVKRSLKFKKKKPIIEEEKIIRILCLGPSESGIIY